jgi:iron complex transport system substrate-binding protein
MLLRFIVASLLALAAEQATAGTQHPEPRRIVSMNLCLDSVLVELVPHEHILALSQYARDPWRSTIASIASKLPYTNETAEEVVALQPDLVLASRHSAIATRNALKRVGVRFELFDVPQSIDESIDQIRRLATLLHREAEGEALIGRIQAAIARARPAPGERTFTAAIYQPGGLSTGANTVTGQLMQIAGLENIAARYGVKSYRPLPLELLVSEPPDVLLVGDTTYGAPTHAERIVHHRALRALQYRMSREPFPARLMYCAGPAMIDALDGLVAARRHASQRLMTLSGTGDGRGDEQRAALPLSASARLGGPPDQRFDADVRRAPLPAQSPTASAP